MKVFVYGTLRRRGSLHHRLRGRFLGSAVAHGWVMHDLGAFPGVTRGVGTVFGELYEVQDLGDLDQVEGCPHFYRRRLVVVFIGCEMHEAWIYYLEHSDAPEIEKGVWEL